MIVMLCSFYVSPLVKINSKVIYNPFMLRMYKSHGKQCKFTRNFSFSAADFCELIWSACWI